MLLVRKSAIVNLVVETAKSEVKVKTRVKSKEIRIAEPPTISDPWILMDAFYHSPRYQVAIEEFFKDKKPDPEVTQKEKERTFLKSSAAEMAFFSFGTRDVYFKYNPAKYPASTQSSINNFIAYKSAIQEGRDDLDKVTQDSERFILHQKVAEALTSAGIVPSLNLGDTFGTFILIDCGFESAGALPPTLIGKIRNRFEH